MKGFRLGAVLRARQAAEDAAKTAAAQARAEADLIAVRIRERERQLDGHPAPGSSSALAFTAALQARRALASSLSDALVAARQAEVEVDKKINEVKEAAIRRRALEHLAERHAAARQHAEEVAEDASADDLTGAAHHRGRRPT